MLTACIPLVPLLAKSPLLLPQKVRTRRWRTLGHQHWWGPPGEGPAHTGVLLQVSLLRTHVALQQVEDSVQKQKALNCELFLQPAALKSGRQKSRAPRKASSSSNRLDWGVLSLGFHAVSPAPGCTGRIILMFFWSGQGPVSHPRDERLPYNASNPVPYRVFTEKQISHTCGKDKARYLHPFCTAGLLRWLPFK